MIQKLTIEIKNLPPMPRNRSHSIANNRLIKTPLARAFEEDLTKRLEKFDEDIKFFKYGFNSSKHFLKVFYLISTPSSELFKKDGGISARAVDCDAHKVFQDVLFKKIGIDDKFIRNVQYYTPVSSSEFWEYKVTIEIYDVGVLSV